MTRPRADIVNLQHATHYQQRLLRQKRWILERLATISIVFVVDIMAYAIMSKHDQFIASLSFGTKRQISRLSIAR